MTKYKMGNYFSTLVRFGYLSSFAIYAIPITIIILSIRNLAIYGFDSGFYGFGHAKTELMFGIVWILLSIKPLSLKPIHTLFVMIFVYAFHEILFDGFYYTINIMNHMVFNFTFGFEFLISAVGLNTIIFYILWNKISLSTSTISFIVLLPMIYVIWSLFGFPITTDINMNNNIATYFETVEPPFYLMMIYSLLLDLKD